MAARGRRSSIRRAERRYQAVSLFYKDNEFIISSPLLTLNFNNDNFFFFPFFLSLFSFYFIYIFYYYYYIFKKKYLIIFFLIFIFFVCVFLFCVCVSCDIKENEAVTYKLEVKPIVTMVKGDKTLIWILTLTTNESNEIQSSTQQLLTNQLRVSE